MQSHLILVTAQAGKGITNSIGMKLVLIPKGTFTMGSPESEEGRDSVELQREVTLSKDFYLGVTEVTQAQYQKVMGYNRSEFQGDEVKVTVPIIPSRVFRGMTLRNSAGSFRTCRRRKKRAASIDCPPKRNGNMRVGLVARLHSLLGTKQSLYRNTAGLTPIVITKHILWVN